MTVREAVELVLQASALGCRPGDQRGKLLVLDMGEPVRIADLARQMIRLAGLKPDEDIEIVYTGLRPGEKLHEELFAPTEEMIASDADGVQLAKTVTVELPMLQEDLDLFEQWLRKGLSEADCLGRLAELLPEFQRAEEDKAASA
jgi:O-antigen biosynthesis protein WbqV